MFQPIQPACRSIAGLTVRQAGGIRLLVRPVLKSGSKVKDLWYGQYILLVGVHIYKHVFTLDQNKDISRHLRHLICSRILVSWFCHSPDVNDNFCIVEVDNNVFMFLD